MFTNLAIMLDAWGEKFVIDGYYPVSPLFLLWILKNHPPCFSISYLDSGSGDQYINITRAWQPNDCYVSSSQSQRHLQWIYVINSWPSIALRLLYIKIRVNITERIRFCHIDFILKYCFNNIINKLILYTGNTCLLTRFKYLYKFAVFYF